MLFFTLPFSPSLRRKRYYRSQKKKLPENNRKDSGNMGLNMLEQKSVSPSPSVRGPNGTPLSLEDLPPANTKRWVIRRKAEVVAAVRGGLLSLNEACERYMITVEEFLSWQSALERHGMAGLRTTRIQDYRSNED